jgi:hypothetical protein
MELEFPAGLKTLLVRSVLAISSIVYLASSIFRCIAWALFWKVTNRAKVATVDTMIREKTKMETMSSSKVKPFLLTLNC